MRHEEEVLAAADGVQQGAEGIHGAERARLHGLDDLQEERGRRVRREVGKDGGRDCERGEGRREGGEGREGGATIAILSSGKRPWCALYTDTLVLPHSYTRNLEAPR